MDDFTLAIVTTLIAIAALGWGYIGWQLYDACQVSLALFREQRDATVEVMEMIYKKEAEIYETADGTLRVRKVEDGEG